MMDELIQTVARTTLLPPEQATLAVAAVLRFLTARLPSALVGELLARLKDSTPALDSGSGGLPPDREGEGA